jgi:ABC-2 type transport system permease protein
MNRRILTLIYKEFLAVWRDKKSRIVLIIPPLIQLCIFAFAATLDVKNVSMGIWNRDAGEKGFQLVEHFFRSKTFTKISYLHSEEDLKTYLDNQKGVAVIVLDEQFSRDLDSGKQGVVQCILDGRKSNTAQVVFGYITTIIESFSKELLSQYPTSSSTIELMPRYWFNPNLIYYWFTVPGLVGVLTMLETLILVALSIARERELGTFDQLLVSPLEPRDILIGKTVPAAIISLLEGTVILLVSVFLFRIPFTGSWLFLYISMLVFICCIIGIGLFLSSLCMTQQQAVLGTFIFMVPAVLLSGFATPIENMPKWLQYITYANPARYFLKICRELFLKATPISSILGDIWPMLVIALVTLMGSMFFFRRRLG